GAGVAFFDFFAGGGFCPAGALMTTLVAGIFHVGILSAATTGTCSVGSTLFAGAGVAFGVSAFGACAFDASATFTGSGFGASATFTGSVRAGSTMIGAGVFCATTAGGGSTLATASAAAAPNVTRKEAPSAATW